MVGLHQQLADARRASFLVYTRKWWRPNRRRLCHMKVLLCLDLYLWSSNDFCCTACWLTMNFPPTWPRKGHTPPCYDRSWGRTNTEIRKMNGGKWTKQKHIYTIISTAHVQRQIVIIKSVEISQPPHGKHVLTLKWAGLLWSIYKGLYHPINQPPQRKSNFVCHMRPHALNTTHHHSFQASHRVLTLTNLWQRFPDKDLLAQHTL